jgi:glyoxylate/hydroxypyruvate reductase A
MGLGVLGGAVLERLAPFGFARLGWSRTPKQLAGIETFAGEAQLDAFLARCDVLVALLPSTPQTRGLLDARRLSLLPAGATLVNLGRGSLVDPGVLLAALDRGALRAAILDVTDPEPLPADHPFWHHPRVLLTPHVAGMTRPETAARVVIDAIRRHRRGEDPGHLVDRSRHY